MEALFIDPTSLPNNGDGDFQLTFLAAVYAFILFRASKLMAHGAELLEVVFGAGRGGRRRPRRRRARRRRRRSRAWAMRSRRRSS
jgi:hypothetical protein